MCHKCAGDVCVCLCTSVCRESGRHYCCCVQKCSTIHLHFLDSSDGCKLWSVICHNNLRVMGQQKQRKKLMESFLFAWFYLNFNSYFCTYLYNNGLNTQFWFNSKNFLGFGRHFTTPLVCLVTPTQGNHRSIGPHHGTLVSQRRTSEDVTSHSVNPEIDIEFTFFDILQTLQSLNKQLK